MSGVHAKRELPSVSRKEWSVIAFLVLLSFVPTIAGTARLVQLGASPSVTIENARFVANPLPVVLHIVAVIPFSILGALQFAPAFRRRHRQWHRMTGRALGVFGLVAAITGLWMTLSYPWAPGDGWGVYVERLVFGSAMLASMALALYAIPRRDFVAHGAWMTRAYAIGMGAATQVLTHLPWFILVDTKPSEGPRAVMMGAGWVINVLVAEWIIRRGSLRNTSQAIVVRQVVSAA
jgi:uncharacterized membrane protein